jgi:hypothetical protein
MLTKPHFRYILNQEKASEMEEKKMNGLCKNNGVRLKYLLNLETATRLLMDYYKAETDGIMIVSNGSVRFVDNAKKEEYERAERKYVKTTAIREKVIEEIENCVFDFENENKKELLTEGNEKTVL